MLPGHITPFRIASFLLNDRSTNPIGISSVQIANSAVLDFIDGDLIFTIVPTLRSTHHRKLQLFRFFSGSHETAHSSGIRTKWFFAKHMLLRINCGFKVHGTIAGRRGQHDNVHTTGNYFLISIKPNKALIRCNLHASFDLGIARIFIDPTHVGFYVVFKNIGHCHNVHVFRSGKKIVDSLTSTSAETNEPGLESLFTSAPHKFRFDDLKCGGCCNCFRSGRKQLASGDLV